MKQLYFVRHGQTDWNAIGRIQGQHNANLSPLGRTQAHAHGKLLATLDIEAMLVSPLDRTRQTAAIISQYIDVPTRYDDRIKELDCGQWSGQLHDDLRRDQPKQWADWQDDQFNYRTPGGENLADLVLRSAGFLDELQAHRATRIAIVSHGMIGRAMLSQLLSLSEQETVQIRQPNDIVFAVALGPQGTSVSHYVDGVGPYSGLVSEDPFG